ncbi:CYFA0S14e00848g1_1 [Cyberlindnera fabianii]|uniref:1-acyl-sn-glycerol-3-phosphate acyltransferase n=1 Tax=Cyberlindnera fabianii TaxID=36022 RepID=A0A061B402_CYBFA|nr:putative 1-acyl-sn-glycerol-3-phosphate acyltransferase [Cyberlindnera fabianii]CDR44208.1 CYFA0S14e00848g1_1 [Cyberlindnera fabianii]
MGILRKLKYYTKTALAVTVLSGCAVYGVLCSIFLSLIGKRHLAQWSTARVFYHSFSTLLGIRIKLIHGERLKMLPAIIVGNHQSTLDIFVLGRIFPKGCTVTSKKSLKWIPFLGWFMTLSGTFFLDRSNKEKSVKTLNKALQNLKDKKRALYIFPEGTRSYAQNPMLLPFKKGAFHLAQQAGIPIIPIVVSNTSSLINAKTETFESGEITIEVLEPFPTEGLKPEDVGQFTENIRDQMVAVCERLGYSKTAAELYADETIGNDTTENLDDYETVPNETAEETDLDGKTSAERTSLLSKD